MLGLRLSSFYRLIENQIPSFLFKYYKSPLTLLGLLAMRFTGLRLCFFKWSIHSLTCIEIITWGQTFLPNLGCFHDWELLPQPLKVILNEIESVWQMSDVKSYSCITHPSPPPTPHPPTHTTTTPTHPHPNQKKKTNWTSNYEIDLLKVKLECI